MNGKKLTTTNGIYEPAANKGKGKATLNIYGQPRDEGELIAKGIEYVPAIGGNDNSSHGDINIYGGKINATGGNYGAGIGSGDENKSDCGTISIYGGDITAQGGADAAGIGAGKDGDVTSGAKITINGGNVEAVASYGGAAIGAGPYRWLISDGDCEGMISINGGNISLCLENVVFSDTQEADLAIIGHGFRGEKDGTLNINSDMKVWFEGKEPVSQDTRTSTCRSFSNRWLHISGWIQSTH